MPRRLECVSDVSSGQPRLAVGIGPFLGDAGPWEIEGEVIALMRPPLNAAGNAPHPFYARVKSRRAALRAAVTPSN